MNRLKPLKNILKPDRTNTVFVKSNLQPVQVRDLHRRLRYIRLHKKVPEEVRGYFETIKNLCLYGWFVYPFYGIAMFLSFTVIEMALRNKFQEEDPKRKWRFGKLIREARVRRLITNNGFSTVRDGRRRRAEVAARFGCTVEPPPDYCVMLEKIIPDLRNTFAHPER